MECEMIVPDLVARPLAEAVLMAKEAGLSVTLVKAEPMRLTIK